MGAAFGLGIGLGGDGFDCEARFGETFGEGVVRAGGPEGDAAAGFQCVRDRPESLGLIQPRIAVLDHGDGAVVHVEQDGIEMRLRSAADDLEDVLNDDFDARIIKQQLTTELSQDTGVIALPMNTMI